MSLKITAFNFNMMHPMSNLIEIKLKWFEICRHSLYLIWFANHTYIYIHTYREKDSLQIQIAVTSMRPSQCGHAKSTHIMAMCSSDHNYYLLHIFYVILTFVVSNIVYIVFCCCCCCVLSSFHSLWGLGTWCSSVVWFSLQCQLRCDRNIMGAITSSNRAGSKQCGVRLSVGFGWKQMW